MKRVIIFFTERSLLVNIISVGILIAGAFYLFSANREAFPKVEYEWVIITTIYPGATPADIEKHISIPIENQLRQVDHITELYSNSIESRSFVICKLDPDLKNKDKSVNDIRDAVSYVSDLPEEAEDPIVLELSSTMVPVLEMSIFNKKGIHSDADEMELRRIVKVFEDRLLELNGVAKIDKQGYRDREMIVEVHPHLLDRFHIGLNEIILALSQKNLNFPGGVVKTGGEDVMIRTIGEVENINEIKNVLIRANDQGNWVRIGDVATVKDSFEEEMILNKTEGRKAITLTVIKKENADIIEVVKLVEKEIASFNKLYGKEYRLVTSNDMSHYVKRRLKVLINNAWIGLILVIFTLFITLGWRISLVTALGIPLAFSLTFIWMGQNGVTVNLMSMFGLIIVLGMVVDDAIIVAENIYRHLEEGEAPREAVINGTSEVVMPVLGTILTTIAAFSPLMFMTGIMGKFMWTLPAVVTVALIASWLEAMLILPSHVMDIEKRSKAHLNGQKVQEGGIFRTIRDFYVRQLGKVLRNRYKSYLFIMLFFLFTIGFAVKNIKFMLFPDAKIERFVVKIEAKTGTSLTSMSKKTSILERIIGKLPEGENGELDNFITTIGLMREQPMDPDEKLGTNYAVIIVNLTPEESRKRKAQEIMDWFRGEAKKHSHEFEKLEVKHIKIGPPDSEDVLAKIMGNDYSVLRKVADEFKAELRRISKEKRKPGLIDSIKKSLGVKDEPGKEKIVLKLKDIKDDYEEGKMEKRIFINEKLARIAGVSVYDVATTVRTSFAGTVATKIKKTDEEIKIRVIFPKKYRDNLKSLGLIKIANRTGNLIPLSAIARYETIRGASAVNRQSWKRAIRVTAEIDEKAKGVSPLEVNNKLREKFKDIGKKYPGILVTYEGEFKESQEAFENLGRSFLIAFIVIYIILVALFRSLSHPIVIVSVIPLTLIGVVWSFFFHGMPLSFVALMGVVGLAGVVVNDSIVLVDFIKISREKGMSPYEASLEAGAKRLRPVFLTTITTFFGLIPTAYGIGGFDPFLKPMAISMSWGLAFGTLITLFATPVLYNIIADLRRRISRKGRAAQKMQPREDFYKKEMEKNIRETVDKEFHESLKAELKNELEKEIKKDLIKDLEMDILKVKSKSRKKSPKKAKKSVKTKKKKTDKKA